MLESPWLPPAIADEGPLSECGRLSLVGRGCEEDCIKQAENQRSGADRTIDWYFHDQAAADFARLAFEEDAEIGNRIDIHVLPYPGGVPKYNPRVR